MWAARKAWLLPRNCPHVPIANCFSAQLPDATLFQLLGILLVAVLFSSAPTIPSLAFCCLAITLCCFDWTRFRPWLYQNSAILLILSLLQTSQPSEGLNICRLIIVSIYFWAGLLKLNATFRQTVFPWFIQPILDRVPARTYKRLPAILGLNPPGGTRARSLVIQGYVRNLALMVPLIEAGFALGLLHPITRPLALLAAVAMHSLILYCISPAGHHYPTVRPWNVCMLLTSCVLFYNSSVGPADVLVGNHSGIHFAVLLLFSFLPVLGLWNQLDPIFSHGHMSGRHVFGQIGLSLSLFKRLPASTQKYCTQVGGGNGPVVVLDIGRWYLGEMGLPAVQQERLLRTIAQNVGQFGATAADLNLTVYRMPAARSTEPPKMVYSGEELLKSN